MARRRHTKRRRRRGGFGFLYKLLSVLVICAAILTAMTLFFRVDNIVVTGQKRYTAEEIQAASGVKSGANMYLLNKYDIVRSITRELPYIEDIRVNRKLPDTLLIEVHESGRPFALVQDGSAWLISAGGKIVDQLPEREAGQYGRISGCQLLAPSVGTTLALATEYASQQTSLLALLEALDAGQVTAYVTDFPDERITTVKNVIALPHLGASTPESEENCAVMAANQVRDFLENGNIKNSVNFPNVIMERSGVQRLCVIHRNVPAVIAQITTQLGADGVNVENMTNKSKGEYAYTMVDAGSVVDAKVIEDIRKVPGVIRLRVI